MLASHQLVFFLGCRKSVHLLPTNCTEIIFLSQSVGFYGKAYTCAMSILCYCFAQLVGVKGGWAVSDRLWFFFFLIFAPCVRTIASLVHHCYSSFFGRCIRGFRTAGQRRGQGAAHYFYWASDAPMVDAFLHMLQQAVFGLGKVDVIFEGVCLVEL